MASNTNDDRPVVISNERPAYCKKTFDDEFLIQKENTVIKEQMSIRAGLIKIAHAIDPRNLLGFFTIVNLITEYDFKKCFFADLLSGFTVGVMQIPSVSDKNIFYTIFLT